MLSRRSASPVTAPRRLTGRIAELDGLRGLAALCVVVAHYFGEVPNGFRIFTVGWIGVDVFFVLSGFLIGSIILRHRRSDAFFITFYLRRGLRIVPIYLVTVLAVFACLAFLGSEHEWTDPALPLASYLTFTVNFAMLVGGEPGNTWLLPTWTLAVEEQFYLLAPILIYFLPQRRILPAFLAGIVLALACRAYFYAAGFSWMAGLITLPARLDLLLSGAAAAYLLHFGPPLDRMRDALRVLPVLCAMALIPIAAADAWVGSNWLKVFAPLFIGVGCASFILAVIHGAPEGMRLRSPMLGFIGTISYALYLIHQPIAGLLHGLLLNSRPDVGTAAQLVVTLAAFAISVAAAWASWRLIEAPLIGFGRRWQYREGLPGGSRDPAREVPA